MVQAGRHRATRPIRHLLTAPPLSDQKRGSKEEKGGIKSKGTYPLFLTRNVPSHHIVVTSLR
jgi:hypothetical protein